MRCLIYSRVSTEDQAREGRSISDQIKICKRFAGEMGYKVIDIYKDEGKTATNMNRSGLRDLIVRCQEEKNIDFVLVLDTDRLSRNIYEHLKIKDMLEKAGTKVLSVSQPGTNDSSPEGKFTDIIIAGANALQSGITGRKVLGDMKEKFLEGWFPARAPIGYINVNIGTEDHPERIIETDNIRASFIKRAFEMFATGVYSADKVNDILFEKGFKSRVEKKIASSEFSRILKKSFYYGLMKWNGLEKVGNHKPIISKELFDQCQAVFEEHNQRANRERKWDFIARGYVYCGICGHRYTAEHNFPRNKSYYHCPSGKHSNKKQNIEVEILESRIEELFKQIQLPESLVQRILAKAKEILSETRDEFDKDKRLLMLRKVQLENKRDVLENKLLEDIITNEVYKRLHGGIETELKGIDVQITDTEIDRKSNIEVFEKLLLLARNIGEAYKTAPIEVKKHYLSIFWDRIEVKDRKIKKAVPTKLYAELFPAYNFALTNNKLSNHKIINRFAWRAWWGSKVGVQPTSRFVP